MEEEFKKRFGEKYQKRLIIFVKKLRVLKVLILIKGQPQYFFTVDYFCDNETSLKMKASGFDDLLAANTKSVHNYSKGFVSFTFENGNYGFLNQMLSVLKKKGIKIVSVEPSAKIVLNVNAAEKDLKGSKHLFISYISRVENFLTPTCMIFQIAQYFEYHLRHYANQYKDGKSYICLEIRIL